MKQRILAGGYVLALMLTIGLTVAYVVHRDLQGRYDFYLRSTEYVQGLQAQLDALKQEEERLKTRTEGLDSDPVEMEADIRRDKNLVRPGETVFRVDLDAATSPLQGVTPQP
jgi:cell division protein FtsB